YLTWIANPVLVKKCDGDWRMCIDFKNLNSACPKDFYPFPNIDCKVESVIGFKYKCFLDAYKGYHQIQMSKEVEEKTAFYTDQGTYYYTKMSFGLKNVGATYQCLVDSNFQLRIGRNLEAYVDGMVIKINNEKMLLADVAETFDNLSKINMKLNPKKCSFRVEEGKFLGYMVTSEGIRANPKKTRVLADLQSPRTLKEMQSLAEKLAALNRFLAKSAERSLPFFSTLKNITKENKHEYKWTIEAEDDTDEWILFTDGASSSKGSGAGLVLIGPSGTEHTYALRLTFDITNNEAEYKALLATKQMNVQRLKARGRLQVGRQSVSKNHQVDRSQTVSKNHSLTYGSKAVILAEIGMPTYRTMMIKEGLNEEEIRLNLDLLTERRELAAIREARRMKQAEWKTRGNWGQNGKGHTELRKHTKMALTSYK
ncbi:reverse transcriptase domain-containing protein, partial [Tanacetum coccineum]